MTNPQAGTGGAVSRPTRQMTRFQLSAATLRRFSARRVPRAARASAPATAPMDTAASFPSASWLALNLFASLEWSFKRKCAGMLHCTLTSDRRIEHYCPRRTRVGSRSEPTGVGLS